MIYCTVQNHPTFHLEERLVNLSRGWECFASLSILLVYGAMGALLYKFLIVWLYNCSVQDFCDWSVYESAGSRNNFMFTRTRGGDQVVYIYLCNFDYAEMFVLKVRTFDSMVSSTWLQRWLFDTSELWTFSAKKIHFIPGSYSPQKNAFG